MPPTASNSDGRLPLQPPSPPPPPPAALYPAHAMPVRVPVHPAIPPHPAVQQSLLPPSRSAARSAALRRSSSGSRYSHPVTGEPNPAPPSTIAHPAPASTMRIVPHIATTSMPSTGNVGLRSASFSSRMATASTLSTLPPPSSSRRDLDAMHAAAITYSAARKLPIHVPVNETNSAKLTDKPVDAPVDMNIERSAEKPELATASPPVNPAESQPQADTIKADDQITGILTQPILVFEHLLKKVSSTDMIVPSNTAFRDIAMAVRRLKGGSRRRFTNTVRQLTSAIQNVNGVKSSLYQNFQSSVELSPDSFIADKECELYRLAQIVSRVPVDTQETIYTAFTGAPKGSEDSADLASLTKQQRKRARKAAKEALESQKVSDDNTMEPHSKRVKMDKQAHGLVVSDEVRSTVISLFKSGVSVDQIASNGMSRGTILDILHSSQVDSIESAAVATTKTTTAVTQSTSATSVQPLLAASTAESAKRETQTKPVPLPTTKLTAPPAIPSLPVGFVHEAQQRTRLPAGITSMPASLQRLIPHTSIVPDQVKPPPSLPLPPLLTPPPPPPGLRPSLPPGFIQTARQRTTLPPAMKCIPPALLHLLPPSSDSASTQLVKVEDQLDQTLISPPPPPSRLPPKPEHALSPRPSSVQSRPLLSMPARPPLSAPRPPGHPLAHSLSRPPLLSLASNSTSTVPRPGMPPPPLSTDLPDAVEIEPRPVAPLYPPTRSPLPRPSLPPAVVKLEPGPPCRKPGQPFHEFDFGARFIIALTLSENEDSDDGTDDGTENESENENENEESGECMDVGVDSKQVHAVQNDALQQHLSLIDQMKAELRRRELEREQRRQAATGANTPVVSTPERASASPRVMAASEPTPDTAQSATDLTACTSGSDDDSLLLAAEDCSVPVHIRASNLMTFISTQRRGMKEIMPRLESLQAAINEMVQLHPALATESVGHEVSSEVKMQFDNTAVEQSNLLALVKTKEERIRVARAAFSKLTARHTGSQSPASTTVSTPAANNSQDMVSIGNFGGELTALADHISTVTRGWSNSIRSNLADIDSFINSLFDDIVNQRQELERKQQDESTSSASNSGFLCTFEAMGGTCNDPSCDSVHFSSFSKQPPQSQASTPPTDSQLVDRLKEFTAKRTSTSNVQAVYRTIVSVMTQSDLESRAADMSIDIKELIGRAIDRLLTQHS
ncbi:hypothetical protein GQ42DRAFT_162712 [Ramicandelaber brevisporus]|nr:hypothetical protein GQ42DRAFT_162712 [Ramicandelaber brevisporus]